MLKAPIAFFLIGTLILVFLCLISWALTAEWNTASPGPSVDVMGTAQFRELKLQQTAMAMPLSATRAAVALESEIRNGRNFSDLLVLSVALGIILAFVVTFRLAWKRGPRSW